MHDVTVANLDAFEAEAARFALSLLPRTEGATLVTLSGDLGAGKTAFTKALAASLGVNEVLTSPTFVLEKIYALPETASFKRLIHIDAYRLEQGADLAPLGFDESMRDAQNLIVLEWPEKVQDGLPKTAYALTITVLPDGGRHISYV
jgi:tRNA threonylcarbamoyladenosine biosynthesis protein TsaE